MNRKFLALASIALIYCTTSFAPGDPRKTAGERSQELAKIAREHQFISAADLPLEIWELLTKYLLPADGLRLGLTCRTLRELHNERVPHKILTSINTGCHVVLMVAFSPVNKTVVFLSGCHKVAHIWAFNNQARIWACEQILQPSNPPGYVKPKCPSIEQENDICKIAISPNGQFVAIGQFCGNIDIWVKHENSTWTLQQTLIGHKGEVSHLAFHKDNNALAVITDTEPVAHLTIWQVGADTNPGEWSQRETLSCESFLKQCGKVFRQAKTWYDFVYRVGLEDGTMQLNLEIWRVSMNNSLYLRGFIPSVMLRGNCESVVLGTTKMLVAPDNSSTASCLDTIWPTIPDRENLLKSGNPTLRKITHPLANTTCLTFGATGDDWVVVGFDNGDISLSLRRPMALDELFDEHQ